MAWKLMDLICKLSMFAADFFVYTIEVFSERKLEQVALFFGNTKHPQSKAQDNSTLHCLQKILRFTNKLQHHHYDEF